MAVKLVVVATKLRRDRVRCKTLVKIGGSQGLEAENNPLGHHCLTGGSNLFKNNRSVFEAGLKKKVTPYEWGKDVAPGLLAVDTIGHTPGHTSYVLSSGAGKVYIQSDVTNNPNPFATHPGWHAYFDQDADMAEKTRRKVYDMVVAEKLQVQGFHYPFPGLGNVVKDGDGYRVVPAPWNPAI
jgi:glyoxylase-like metal-dependent hydrolase (beta-lactamase superfamily II)